MPQATGIALPDKGIVFTGVVTHVATGQFSCAGLTGYGDHFFDNWYIYIVRRISGAAISEEKKAIASYISSFSIYGGTFLYDAAYSSPLAVGDEIYIIHPSIVDSSSNATAIPSNNLKLSSDLEVSASSNILVLAKTIIFDATRGHARIFFDLKSSMNIPISASAVIYRNGTPIYTSPGVYTTYTDNTGSYQTFSQDIPAFSGDSIQIYFRRNGPAGTGLVYLRNFRIGYDIVDISDSQYIADTIYYDETKGVNGTEWPIGSPSMPSNNIADIRTMCADRNISKIYVKGYMTLDASMERYDFGGDGAGGAVDFNGQSVDSSTFTNLYITGAQAGAGEINCFNCGINVTNFRGSAIECGLGSITTVDHVSFVRCYGQAIISCGAATVMFWNFVGSLNISNVNDAGSMVSIYLADSSYVALAASCTDGYIGVRGDGILVNNSTGSVVNDLTLRKFITTGVITTVNQLLALVNAIQTLKETGGSVTLTGPGTEDDIYINNSPTGVFEPLVAKMDFTNNAAADTVVVRTYYRIAAGGGWLLQDEVSFAGVISPALKNIDLEPNRFGVRITAENTAGAVHAYGYEIIYRG